MAELALDHVQRHPLARYLHRGFHVYAPDLPGLHTQGDDLDEATKNAEEALALYVEGVREDGGSLDTGVIRRKFPLPA